MRKSIDKNVRLSITVREFILYIIYFLPKFITKPLKLYYEKRKIQTVKERLKRTKVSKDEIIKKLDKLNLGEHDIFLHSSMMNIGKISGGTKFLSNLILEKVDTNKNTLLISALPFRGQFKYYLEKNPVFDVRTAPVEMGAVNEYLSLHPEAMRSLHPTHSVIAIGEKSKDYTIGHHLDDTPFSIHSPYYKLIEYNAKILMFGAGLDTLTFVHVIEDILGVYFPVNPYLKKIYSTTVINTNGESMVVNTLCHDPFKAIKRNGNKLLLPYFYKFEAILSYDTIGESVIYLLDCRKIMYAYYMALLDGISVYGKFRLNDALKNKLLEELNKYESQYGKPSIY